MTTSEKQIWITIAVVLFILWTVGIYKIVQKGRNDPNIGQTIVIKQDTLMVMGYDARTRLYVLDDGREVSESIIELFTIKE